MPQSAPLMGATENPPPSPSPILDATTSPRGWARWVDPSGPTSIATYALWGAVPLIAASLVDLLRVSVTPPPLAYPWAVGLALMYGGLMGAGFGLGFKVNYRLPHLVSWVFWLVVSLVGGWNVASSLGVMAKLDGPDRRLAIVALSASLVGSLVFTVMLSLMQPHDDAPRGKLAKLKGWRRFAAAGVMFALIPPLVWADRTQFPGTYPVAHTALRLMAVWTGMLVLVLITGRVQPPKNVVLRVGRWVAIGAVAIFPVLSMRAHHADTIHLMIYQPYAGMTLATMRALFDLDRDGYSAFFGGGDCAPFDATISPGQAEIPQNGIDDNCRLGDAAKPLDRVALQNGAVAPKDSSPMSVVLITIDTLRPDRMSLYGHNRPTTPYLDRIAKQGVRFDRAYAAGGWTSISLSSMLRGVYPRRLGWNTLYETNKYRLLRGNYRPQLADGEVVKMAFGMAIDEPLKPLAWWLKRRGMRTAAVIDDGYSQFLDAKYMSEGFDEYIEVEKTLPDRRDDTGTADLAIATLEKMPQAQPFFLWTHFFGPHSPSVKHEGTKYWGETEPDGYDHEIAFVDLQIRRVLTALTTKMGIDPYMVIITSDHGEKIRTAYHRDHGSDVEEESIRVPLVIYGGGFPVGKTSDALVSLIDLFPTILAVTETPSSKGLDGIDLAAMLRSNEPPPERILIAETWRINPQGRPTIDVIGAFDGRKILMYDRVNNLEVTKTQGALRVPTRTVYGAPPPADLKQRLDEYVEETGGVIRLLE